MRAAATGLALAAMVSTAGGAAHAAPPKVGQPAPDFTVTTFGGKTVRLADLKGDVVVLNFWATWCGPCRAELPLLESYFRQTAQYGVQVLALATEDGLSPYDLARVWSRAKLTIPAVRHLKGPYREMAGVPTSYIIDRHGVLAYAKAGAFDIASLNAVMLPLMREPIPKDAPEAGPVAEPQAAPPTPKAP